MTTAQPMMCRFFDNGCGVLLEIKDGRPVKVPGDRNNLAYSGWCRSP
ncbi:MAG: hypothetical protein GDA49_02270 [Rhodospirillales bacterium]|nr:hypothetical protein [Rhodospirillales bacterium]